jgi:NO-binding membrane sensor protein with MHYT domain
MLAPNTMATAAASPRNLVCHYNPSMVAAALVVSLLGAFTSTQLMTQARGARTLNGVLIWTVLGCLTFGFCGTWCLHFLGMLSCEFDVPIGLDPPLTVLSAVLAVSFTFGALSTDLIQKYWRQPQPKNAQIERRSSTLVDHSLASDLESRQSSEPLLPPSHELSNTRSRKDTASPAANGTPQSIEADQNQDGSSGADALLADIRAAHQASSQIERSRMNEDVGPHLMLYDRHTNHRNYGDVHSDNAYSTAGSQSPLSFDDTGIESLRSNFGYDSSPDPASNTLLFAARAVYSDLTITNVTKGFVWSLALTNMHFMGVKALDIPGGFVALSPPRVVLCALISWSVCCVGVILMAGMEVNFKQQILFSIVAATGVAAVHFSG